METICDIQYMYIRLYFIEEAYLAYLQR